MSALQKTGPKTAPDWTWRLTLALFAAPVALIIVFAYNSQVQFESAVLDQFQRHQLAIVKSAARGIRERLTNTEKELRHYLAKDPTMTGWEETAYRAVLERVYQEMEGYVHGLYRLDGQGAVLAAYPSKEGRRGVVELESSTLQRALAAPGTIVVDYSHPSPDRHVLNAVTAVLRDGAPVGAVQVLVDLDALAREFILPLMTTVHSQAYLLDEQGHILYGLDETQIGKTLGDVGRSALHGELTPRAQGSAAEGSFEHERPGKGPELVAFRTFTFGDKRLVLAKAALRGELAGPFRSNRRSTWGFAAVLIALVALGAYKFAKQREQRLVLEMERGRAEEVATTKAFFERLVGEAGDAIVVIDAKGLIITWNTGAERIFGWRAAEALGRSYIELQAGTTDAGGNVGRVFAGEMLNVEVRRRRKDGTFFDALVTATPVRDAEGRVFAAQAVIKDITDRKRAEEALRESQRMLATLMGNLPGMAYRCLNDRDWTMVFISEGCLELTGYHPADLVRNRKISYADLIHPYDRDMVWSQVQAALPEGEPFQLLYRIVTAEKEEKWVWEKGIGVFSAEGELLALEGFIADITERKQSEEAALRARAQLEYLLTSSPGVIWTAKAGGDWGATFMSRNVKDQLGYGPEEFLARSDFWVEHLHPDDRERVLADLPRIFDDDYHLNEYRFLHQDGSYRWMHAEMKLIRDPGGRPLECVGFWTDITERKEREEELQRAHHELRTAYEALERAQATAVAAEKLAALGRLTAGVSHEILNPLNAITIGLHLLLKDPDTPAEIAEALADMMEQARRITKISQDLLYFSRQRTPERRQLDLNSTVKRTVALVEHELRLKDVGLDLKLSEELPNVLADEGQLQQVVLNLVNNARDVLPRGGKLVVQTSEVRPIFIHEGRVLELRVEDTGPGIPAEHIGRIFDPFFTTKPVGKGTGLGLSICQGIVESHGGSIWAENLPGGGAAFVIRLGAANE